MRIPENEAAWLQFSLVLLAKEEYMSTSGLYGGVLYREDPHYLWQLLVDALYRCLISGLIDSWNQEDWKDEMKEGDIPYMIRNLAKYHYDEVVASRKKDEDGGVEWFNIYYGTPLLQKIVAKHGISDAGVNDPANPAFIEEIESIFEANGVPWRDAPLIQLGENPHRID